MGGNVELPEVNLAVMDARLAKEQRELLKLATRQRKGRVGPDEAAACKLLYYFSRGMIKDEGTQQAIMDGMREVAAYTVNGTILRKNSKSPLGINPLMFFNGLDAKATNKNKKDERVALVAAFNAPNAFDQPADGPLMTRAEMQRALTHRWTRNDVADRAGGGKPLPKRERPKSLKAVEKRLIEYVQAKHGIESREDCRDYVHSSFPAYAWHEDADKPFPYPTDW